MTSPLHSDGTPGAPVGVSRLISTAGQPALGPGSVPQFIFVGACAFGIAWLSFSLIINSAFGRADNGDYGRFMAPFADKPYGFIANWPPPDQRLQEDRFFQWWIPYWDPAKIEDARYFGSTVLFWLGGKFLSRILLGDDVVSLRMSGAIACLVLMGAYGLVLWSARKSACSGRLLMSVVPMILASALVLSEVCYGSFINSYFQEGGSFVFLVCLFSASVFVCGGSIRFERMPILAAAACLFATAKVQHGFVGPLLLVLIVVHAFRIRPRGRYERAGLAVSICVIVGAMPATFWLNGHRPSRRNNAYHSLYFGILGHCHDPTAQLRAEGLPEESVALIGLPAYSNEAGVLIGQLGARLAHRSTFRISMREPTALISLLREAAMHAGNIEMDYLGMRAQGAVDYRSIPSGIHVWSRLRRAVIPRGDGLLLLLGILIVGFGVSCIVPKRLSIRSWAFLGLLFTLISGLELCASTLGDGLYEIDRHLFASNLALDLTLCICPTLVMITVLGRRDEATSNVNATR